jgi:hypothetical protein
VHERLISNKYQIINSQLHISFKIADVVQPHIMTTTLGSAAHYVL